MAKTNEPEKRENAELKRIAQAAHTLEESLLGDIESGRCADWLPDEKTTALLALSFSVFVRHFAGAAHAHVGALRDGLREVEPGKPDMRPLALIAAGLQPIAQAAQMQVREIEGARLDAMANRIVGVKR